MPPVVTIFGSARVLPGEPEYAAAQHLGNLLAASGFVICNGGYAGVMEASARGAKEAGGTTIGVTFPSLGRSANRWIDREIPEPDLPRRLLKLVELGNAYVILKGGTGTLLELACVWEFLNKGLMPERPAIILGPFWRSVVGTLKEELAWEGAGDCARYITEVDTPEECVGELRNRLSPSTA